MFLSLSNCTNITGIYYALYKNTLKFLSGTQTFMTMLTKLEMNHDIWYWTRIEENFWARITPAWASIHISGNTNETSGGENFWACCYSNLSFNLHFWKYKYNETTEPWQLFKFSFRTSFTILLFIKISDTQHDKPRYTNDVQLLTLNHLYLKVSEV